MTLLSLWMMVACDRDGRDFWVPSSDVPPVVLSRGVLPVTAVAAPVTISLALAEPRLMRITSGKGSSWAPRLVRVWFSSRPSRGGGPYAVEESYRLQAGL